MFLQVRQLAKKYKDRWVVNGVNLDLKEREIIGLLGPNGAGKTTTFYILMGLVRPDQGYIFLNKQEVTKMPMYKRARLGLGYLAQEPTIFRGLTVKENLMAILELTSSTNGEREKKAQQLLEEFGLTQVVSQVASSLSGGEKRRLEIARALITEPKLLLLDEPFVGIDPITVTELQKLIFRLRDRGIGILITDHNVRETLEVIDRAYIMYQGKILLEGKAQDLLDNPEARKVYLGENFRM